MGFYICIIMLSVLLMIAMILHVLRYSGFTKTQKTWYIVTFSAIILCSLSEFAVHCGAYDPKFKVILTIITVIQFSLAPLLGILFSGALGVGHQMKMAIIYFIINLVTEVICAPFGAVFYFNDEGYFRGNAFIIYEVFYLISLAYLIVCMVIVGRKFSNRDFLTIGMVLVILVAGILPMIISKINITYLAIAISSCVCYIYYNDLVQQDIQVELIENQNRVSSMQNHIITRLANLIENRDIETGEHVARTSRYVKMLAEFARNDGLYLDTIDDHFITLLYTLSPMHDVGKIIVSDTILKKPAKLNDEEKAEMRKHASAGGEIVKEVLNGITSEEYINFAADIATYHHEWWDGNGYPKGLKETQIPLSARIMAIADVYDALISKRCYKEAIPVNEALEIMKSESGTHFDPYLLDVFFKYKEYFIK